MSDDTPNNLYVLPSKEDPNDDDAYVVPVPTIDSILLVLLEAKNHYGDGDVALILRDECKDFYMVTTATSEVDANGSDILMCDIQRLPKVGHE